MERQKVGYLNFLSRKLCIKYRGEIMISKTTKLKVAILILMVIGLCSGCNGNQKQIADTNKDFNDSLVKVSNPISQSVANQVKENISTEEEISDVKAVNSDKELLVAIKVKQFDRFQLKKIEKNLKSDLEKMHPDYKVLVSSDQKMYFELDKLEQKLLKNNLSMKKLEKDIKKIKSLMKEQS
ncbi:YhcN/YlaJ family sporulation lipoprotein [Bacillus sp. Cr_A10]|uniref:YhcN/YlaJ family sporulation lipoprotein n=1 Tax=Bacillus sp. Cr_A10 TaxID=3033993 RepID=UPI0031F40354